MRPHRLVSPVLFLFVIVIMAPCAAAELSVLDYGAVPDGHTDNTEAFQKALDAAHEKGESVIAPAGQYRFDGTLIMPPHTQLIGEWRGPHFPNHAKGTVFMAFSGRGDEDGEPFITLGTNCILRGVSIWYPEQTVENPQPYPWTLAGRGHRWSIIDVGIANAWNGIDAGSYYHDGHTMRNITMTAMRRGVYIDRCYDIGRAENIHINEVNWRYLYDRGDERRNSGEDGTAIRTFGKEHLEGFIIGRCDWYYMVNCFVIWANVGFKFIQTPPEDLDQGPAPQANILITQSGADLGPLSVKVEKVQNHSGIAFENSQFMGGIEVDDTNTGPIKFTNCGFWGVSRSGSHIINDGDCTIMLTACHFSAFDDERFHPGFYWDPDVPLVDFRAGTLMMSSILFKDLETTPKHHIRIGEDVVSAQLFAVRTPDAPPRIKDESNGALIVLGE